MTFSWKNAGRWRFGLRESLIAVLVIGCGLGGWHWRDTYILYSLARELDGDRGPAFRLVFHPKFASSGLRARIGGQLNAEGKFWHQARTYRTSRSAESATHLLLEDHRGRNLIVSFDDLLGQLSWIDLGDHGWTNYDFDSRADGTYLTVAGGVHNGTLNERTYRVDPSQIVLVHESAVPFENVHAGVEVRYWISPSGRSVPGPESDLQ